MPAAPAFPAPTFRMTLLATAIALGLAACGGGSDAPAAPAPAAGAPAPSPAPDPAPAPAPSPAPVPQLPAVQSFTPEAGSTEGSSDASTAFTLPDGYMLVADDEANVLRVYPRAGGAAVLAWSYENAGPKLAKELDLEAGARIGDTLYLSGSMSNKKDGAQTADRSHLFAVKLSGTGAQAGFEYIGEYAGLEAALVAWDSGNGHGRGAGHFGFAASAANGVVPEQVHGFSLEGMAVAPDGRTLWLGFRAPLTPTGARDQALLVPLLNAAALVDGTASAPTFGDPIQLDLGGRGIRSIDRGTDGQYLVLAGPAGPASADVERNFALFAWSGVAGSPAVELDNDLEALRRATLGSFESIVEVPGPVAAGTAVQLLLDNGDTVWPGQSAASKDLAPALQRFEGHALTLGTPRADTRGPQLKASLPADDSMGVPLDSTIQLRFDEPVRFGAGSLELHRADGTLVQRFSAGSVGVQRAFNVLTLTPSQPLDSTNRYYLTVQPTALQDAYGNPYAGISDAQALNFEAASLPTTLAAGDLLFMAGNAEAPDAFAFVLLKPINGGTQIGFTDRDRVAATEFAGITNESAFVWTADRNLPAGSIVTLQTDVSGNPVASKGHTQGAPGGIGKAETIYAFQGGSIAGLGDGMAGEITAPGTFLASLTLGGAAGDIPPSLVSAGTAFSFTVAPSNQTNALYSGSLDRGDLAAFAARVKNPANWTVRYRPEAGWPLTGNSLFAGE